MNNYFYFVNNYNGDYMKNLSIMDYVVNNFKNSTESDIKSAIDMSTNNNDEEALPGMGVFLSILWKNCNDSMKKDITSVISKNIC